MICLQLSSYLSVPFNYLSTFNERRINALYVLYIVETTGSTSLFVVFQILDCLRQSAVHSTVSMVILVILVLMGSDSHQLSGLGSRVDQTLNNFFTNPKSRYPTDLCPAVKKIVFGSYSTLYKLREIGAFVHVFGLHDYNPDDEDVFN